MLPWEDASSAGLSRFQCTLVIVFFFFFLFDLYLFARQNIALIVFLASEQD